MTLHPSPLHSKKSKCSRYIFVSDWLQQLGLRLANQSVLPGFLQLEQELAKKLDEVEGQFVLFYLGGLPQVGGGLGIFESGCVSCHHQERSSATRTRSKPSWRRVGPNSEESTPLTPKKSVSSDAGSPHRLTTPTQSLSCLHLVCFQTPRTTATFCPCHPSLRRSKAKAWNSKSPPTT